MTLSLCALAISILSLAYSLWSWRKSGLPWRDLLPRKDRR